MKLPEIIIIGAPKCGTTPLWYNLDKHPKIQMATKSPTSVEFNFWKANSWHMGVDWYKSRFVKGKISGEKSTTYYYTKKSMKEIWKQIPNAKLILCVRNPIDRAFSNFQMNRNAGKVPNQFTYGLFKKRYARQGLYMVHIEKNVLPFFDKSQLHICVQEHMKKDMKNEMKKVFDFLGVEDLGYDEKEIGGVLLKNRSRGEDIKLNHKQKFYRVWSKHKETLTGPVRKECLKFFTPFNKRLYKFLGYEIEEWTR